MGRLRQAPVKRKGINPMWRGVGLVILIVFAVGGYFLAGYLIEAKVFPFVPTQFKPIIIHKALPALPGKEVIKVGFSLLLDVLVYAIMFIVYTVVNPLKHDQYYVPPVRPKRKGRGNMVR